MDVMPECGLVSLDADVVSGLVDLRVSRLLLKSALFSSAFAGLFANVNSNSFAASKGGSSVFDNSYFGLENFLLYCSAVQVR